MIKVKGYWSSHLPVLISVMEKSDGDVLELGIGSFSTPYLHWKCYIQNRKIFSYENDPTYFKGYSHEFSDLPTDFHKFLFVTDWKDIDIEKPWGVVFVDNGPAIARKDNIKRIVNYAKYVIVHDTQPKQEYEYLYNEIYPLFKYRFDFKDIIVNTTILSNFVDVTNFKI